MICMCTVYEFPMNKKLSKDLVKKLDESSRMYIEVMVETLEELYGDEPTDENYEEFMGIMLEAYLKSLEKAIDEL